MRIILLYILLLAYCVPIFSQNREESEDPFNICKYEEAYSFLIQDSIYLGKNIYIYNETQPLDWTLFTENFLSEKSNFLEVFEKLDDLHIYHKANFVEIKNCHTQIFKSSLAVFFSNVYQNYLMAEIFEYDSAKQKKGYDGYKTFNTSFCFLFFYKENRLQNVKRIEVAYD